MGKKYADFMDEISADDLYKGLLAFGLFSNKIPPVFSSTSFLITVKKIIRHFPIVIMTMSVIRHSATLMYPDN